MVTDDTTTRPDAADDDPSADDTAAASTSATAPSAGRGAWLPWAIAAMAVITAIVTTVQWRSLAGDAEAREAVASTAAEFMATLTNWDASDGLEDTRESLREAGTGRFLDEVDELFGGPLGADLEAAQAVSTGEVQDVFTQSIEGDTAIVFAVALQTLESELSDQPDVTVRSAKLTLERTEEGWLVENVQLLVDGDPTSDVTEPSDGGQEGDTPATEEDAS